MTDFLQESSATMKAHRVVVTGMGTIGPVGLNVPTAWANVVGGKSGIGRITLFDTTGLRVQIAGEAWGFNPADYMPAKDARRADRFAQFAIAATQEALTQAQFTVTDENADDVGAIIGCGAGGSTTYIAQQKILDTHGPHRLSPLLIPMIIVDSASTQVSMMTGLRGPTFGVASACATAADAIGQAFETIRRGDAKVMITGGAEASCNMLGIPGFDQLGALSRRNENPQEASRPFDAERDGFVLSEGAGILVLESLEHALERGAEPLAEVLSYAGTSDAVHLTQPDEGAVQAARAITRVLDKAGRQLEDVDYYNAHATATPLGDVFEVRALKRAFGEAAYRLPISATKSSTGHLLGGAGAVEAIWCIMAMRDGMIPPTINYQTPDPECDLDFVPNTARPADIQVALSAAFAFGGHNTMLLLRRWPPVA